MPSCRLEFSPTLMPGPSPRNTVLNQMLQLAPISTSPINAAFGAMKADAAMRGEKPLKGTVSPDIETLSPQNEGCRAAHNDSFLPTKWRGGRRPEGS